jgi:hypothetical protein
VLRAEGIAELVAPFSLGTCTVISAPSGYPAPAPAPPATTAFTIQVFTTNSVPVTSYIDGGGNMANNEPQLVVQTGLGEATTYYGSVSGTGITFSDVSLPTVVSAFTTSLQLVGLRVNANVIPTGSSMGVTVLATSNDPSLNGASSGIFPVTGGSYSPYELVPNVAVSLTSLNASANLDGPGGIFSSDGKTILLKPCYTGPTFDPKNPAGSAALALVTFEAAISNAFSLPAIPDGFDDPTRLTVSLTNVPAGVVIWAPTNATDVKGTGSAVMIVNFGPDLSGGYVYSATGNSAKFVALTPDSNGTVTAVYQLNGFKPQVKNTVWIQLYESVDNPVAPSPLVASVLSAGYAPLASGSAIPRFTAGGALLNTVYSFGLCTSEVLFPYVVVGGGYDTGIALANIGGSAGDPTQSLAGTCALSFYPTAGGAPATYTTPVIPANGTFALSILQANPGANQQGGGYAVAKCNFVGAAGYAYVANLRGSASYLAQTLAGATGN